MTEQYEKVSVSGFSSETLEAGTYPAALTRMEAGQGAFDPHARWVFLPEGKDIEVVGFTTLSAGRTAKGMEWARRILGKSTATDQQYGRDIKDKRPTVNWGEDELKGKSCRIVVEKTWDEEYEEYKNKVVNVLPPEASSSANGGSEDPHATASDEDFDDIPF